MNIRWLQPNLIWRADVGSDKDGHRESKMYHIQVEYITHIPETPEKQYYMRASAWSLSEKETKEYLKFIAKEYGPIRQAWITEYNVSADRHPLYDKPHNISKI